MGAEQRYYNWVFELTGTIFLYTDNESFFGSNRLEQEPLVAVDGSVEYDFPGGPWISVGAGIGSGGQSEVNGVEKDDFRRNFGWSLSAGFPITPSLGLKAT